MALSNLIKKRQALKDFSFEAELMNIVVTNKDKLADLQATQLFTGIKANGERINPPYSAFTIQEKIRKGQPYDRVTFRDTGELYSSLFALVSNKKFAIKSNSFKFDKMIKRSGVNVVGLNYDSRATFATEIVRPGINKAYNEKVKKV